MTASQNLSKDHNSTYHRFDSAEDFAAYMRAANANCRRHGSAYNDDWSGRPFNDALDTLEFKGDAANVPAAQAILNQVQSDESIFTSGLPMPVDCIAGYEPHVPHAIIGLPKSMIRREMSETQSITTPLRIYVDVAVSAGVSEQEMRNRGVAILALAMALQITRPIELHLFSLQIDGRRQDYHSQYTLCTIKMTNTPIDLSRASYCLSSKSFFRNLCLSFIYASLGVSHSGSSTWPFKGNNPNSEVYKSKARELMGMEAQDLLITGGYLNDTLMLNNPVAWVKREVALHSQIEPIE